MLTELLAELASTKGLREALPYFAKAVEAAPTLSATEIIAEARGAGLSFRDSGAFNIISQLKANVATRLAFKLTAFDELPSTSALETAVTPLSKDYSFLVSIRGLNQVTGEREKRFVTVVSDELLTPEQILETALGIPTGAPGSQSLINQTVTIESGKISPLAR